MGFLDLLDPSDGPEFFWQVISGPPCIFPCLVATIFGKQTLLLFFPNQILIAYKQNSI
jgi:hypothetical protein